MYVEHPFVVYVKLAISIPAALIAYPALTAYHTRRAKLVLVDVAYFIQQAMLPSTLEAATLQPFSKRPNFF